MAPGFDAIVVGSGMTGGWAAKELCERGLRVLVLERGRPIEHGSDYVGEHVPPWELRFRGLRDRRRVRELYPIQGENLEFEEGNEQFWASDVEEPYQSDPDAPFHWTRASVLGGRSLVWGRQVYRWSDLDFEANAREGVGVDWPIRYADLAPWYDHVERFIGVSGQAEGLPQLPDGVFQPPMQLNCVEQAARDRIAAAFPGRRLTIGRAAVLTRDLGERRACHYCGPCWRGCSTGSYFSSLSSTLPAARATGRLTVQTHSVVSRVLHDPRSGRARGVEVLDARSGERREVSARIVFLCASALRSAQILLQSRSERLPDGLANSSGVLGRYLMDHMLGCGAFGFVPGFEDGYYAGNRPNGIYVARFRNVDEAHPEFARGYGYEGLAMRLGWRRAAQVPGFGRALKEELRRPGPWLMAMVGFGECLPYAHNRVTLDERHRDPLGQPQLRVHFEWGANERAMARDITAQAVAMLEVVGAQHVIPTGEIEAGGQAIHEMGTARMGRDPRTSVLNAQNQCHDVPNVFVTDGACMTSSACQNPSLTYMALTARAAAFAAGEVRRGAL